MGIDPNLTVLVYENGMGVYIHRLFAEKHRIKPETEVHPSLLLRHEQEIPFSERARMKSWIHPDDRKFLETRSLDPVFWGTIDPPIQSKVESY